MNSEQARFVLRAFRPGIDREDSPEFQEAFAQLRKDRSLAAWFDREVAADAVLRAKLISAVNAPEVYRGRILALPRMVELRAWWRRPGWLALAASIVLLLTSSALWLTRPNAGTGTFAVFRADLVAASQEMPHVSFMASDIERIRERLRSEKAPADLVVPASLAQAAINGCRVVDWHGRKVSLVCFHLNDGGHVDLLIIQNVDWNDEIIGEAPVLARVGQVNTASWSTKGRTYILCASASDDEMRRLLSV